MHTHLEGSVSRCPTCGTRIFEPGEPAEPDTTFARYSRLVAACRKLREGVTGEWLLTWSVSLETLAEFDAALAACEVDQ